LRKKQLRRRIWQGAGPETAAQPTSAPKAPAPVQPTGTRAAPPQKDAPLQAHDFSEGPPLSGARGAAPKRFCIKPPAPGRKGASEVSAFTKSLRPCYPPRFPPGRLRRTPLPQGKAAENFPRRRRRPAIRSARLRCKKARMPFCPPMPPRPFSG